MIEQGYWSRVYYQAAALIDSGRGLNGEMAYKLARQLVDQTLLENTVGFNAPTLWAQRAHEREVLVLETPQARAA